MEEIITAKDLCLWYSSTQALKNVSIPIYENSITAFIGPSGCGKSTFLKTLNRMNDLVPGVKITGELRYGGKNIYGPDVDVNGLRREIGMVFQKPNPFPMSIYDNIAYGPRTHGVKSRAKLDDIVERSLRGAAIWDEVKDRLKKNALGLSGGQQQRLCIARALAVEPKVLLMDEPTSALDPISTGKIEELTMQLREKYTIVMVTHNMQQAVRVSDYTAFFLLGELVEFGGTEVWMMRNRFDEQLARMNRELIQMGALCEEAISLASRALDEGSREHAEKVAAIAAETDQMERDIESLCLKLLLQQQPEI